MASGPLVGEKDDREKRSKFYSKKQLNKSSNSNSFQHRQQTLPATAAASNDPSSHHRLQPGAQNSREPGNGNGVPGYVKVDKFVKISFDLRNREEVRSLKRKLSSELDQVVSLVKRLEAKQVQLSKNASRLNSQVGSVNPPNNRVNNESVKKKKPTPRMSTENPDAVKLTPMASNKKLKSNERGSGFLSDKDLNRLFKSCGNLLEGLMKHKHAWVFNNPVDAKGLGLLDYYTIVKHPMDLGTVKTRLSRKIYKSPKEFAEDVRLTFNNAMLYNPKGQDVHVMAQQLSDIFEEKWTKIEAECRRLEMGRNSGLPTPISRTAPAPPVPAHIHASSAPVHAPTPAPAPALPSRPSEMRTLERAESRTMTEFELTKAMDFAHQVKTPVPVKSKANDPVKRDMTYEEKQRLSIDLQDMPSEKLEHIVQIIRRRNPVLSQEDDEIEVDIDSVDSETLWELHSFVNDYKKSLSESMRKTEFSGQSTAEAGQNIHDSDMEPMLLEVLRETEAVEKIDATSSPVQGDNQGDNGSESSSSSGSSSGSGSSSSDSDSDSSSGCRSDADD